MEWLIIYLSNLHDLAWVKIFVSVWLHVCVCVCVSKQEVGVGGVGVCRRGEMKKNGKTTTKISY